ncbi:MAG: hypothetical protein IKW90_07670 [Lachnospiraceae bacterium]|nr:hypothetical protein [Lachnospiraceae bacterium]
MASSPFASYIWAELYNFIGNEYGTAGLMGNLQAESGMIPYRLQGDFTTGYSTSIRYTNNVDQGLYTESEFVHDSKGYGLAQWTFSSRKQGLYNMYISGAYSSIGDVGLGVSYLISELSSSYSGVLAVLRSATSVREASDIVLHQFENPAEQGPAVEVYRASLGQAIYDEFAGGSYPPPIPPEPPTPEQPSIPYWLLFKLSENGRRLC